ncbi:MAG: helix-turn-helix transcriptional regulator [Patescibacteria group bacterium]
MTDKLEKDFGNKVRELRKQKGISQEGLAGIADLDRTYIGGIERGIRNPSLRNIGKIAKALNVKPTDLFDF